MTYTSLSTSIWRRRTANTDCIASGPVLLRDATTRAAFDLGFACTVAEDAWATMDLSPGGEEPSPPQTFMAALSSPYARVVSTRIILDGDGS